jgi:hypothetical protein
MSRSSVRPRKRPPVGRRRCLRAEFGDNPTTDGPAGDGRGLFIRAPVSPVPATETSMPDDRTTHGLSFCLRRSRPAVAIVGATGAVGRELPRVPAEREFPLAERRLFASPDPAEARGLLAKAPGLCLVGDPTANRSPLPAEACGRDEVLVGHPPRPRRTVGPVIGAVRRRRPAAQKCCTRCGADRRTAASMTTRIGDWQ